MPATVIFAFILTRVLILLAALAMPAAAVVREHRVPDFHCPLVRWDSGHYLAITTHGYPREISDTAAFLPLYPLLCRPLAALIDPQWAMVAVSHIAALAACLLMYAWVASLRGPIVAAAAVLLLFAYPHAFIFSAAYPEGLFTCFAIAALWAAQRRWWLIAAIAAALAGATRPTGICLAAVVALHARFASRNVAQSSAVYAASPNDSPPPTTSSQPPPRPHRARFQPYRAFAARLLHFGFVFTIGTSGFAAYIFYLSAHYDQPNAFRIAQQTWSADATWTDSEFRRALLLQPVIEPAFRPIKDLARGQFTRLAEPMRWNALLNLIMLIIAFIGLISHRAAAAAGLPRIYFLLPILIFLMAYLPDTAGGLRLYGIGRYHLASLPCFILVAAWLAAPANAAAPATPPSTTRRIAFWSLIVTQSILQALFLRAFCLWEPVS